MASAFLGDTDHKFDHTNFIKFQEHWDFDGSELAKIITPQKRC